MNRVTAHKPGDVWSSDLLRSDEVEQTGTTLELGAWQPTVTGVGCQQPRSLGHHMCVYLLNIASNTEKIYTDVRKFATTAPSKRKGRNAH